MKRCAVALIGALTVAGAGVWTAAAQERAPDIAAVDWGLAETLTAIGAPPVAVPEKTGYEAWVREPDLPADAAEIGLRATPNLEYLAAIDPDLIVSTSQFAAIAPILSWIAPIETFDIYTADLTPYDNAVRVTRRLGAITGREQGAANLIEATGQKITDLAATVHDRPMKKVLVLSFIDHRHVRVFSEGSMFDDVLERAGLENAWEAEGNFWGFSLASIESFADLSQTAILIVEPVPPAMRLTFEDPPPSSLIGQLPIFAKGGYRIVPPVWSFGALPAAARFADTLLESVDFLERSVEG